MSVSEAERASSSAVVDHAERFPELVERHSRRLYQLAYRMIGNESDAKDVLQEALFRAYQHWPGFEGRADPGTWLHRIVVNCAVDLLRATRCRPDRQRPQPIGEVTEVLAANGAGPERLAASAESRHRIDVALTHLGPLERAAFSLRHFEGCSIAEIGVTLGISPNAAKQHIFRAIRKLRLELGDQRSVI